MKQLLLGILVICIIIGIAIGIYQAKRWWNYYWGYASQVETSICEMVKPEYLKNPEKCK